MLTQESDLLEFNQYDKLRYKNFALSIDTLVLKIHDDANYVSDIDKIIKSLENVLQVSSLEDYIQNPVQLIKAFVKGDYYYKTNPKFSVLHLKHFIELLKENSIERRKVIVNNLWQRFDNKPRYSHNPAEDDLPF